MDQTRNICGLVAKITSCVLFFVCLFCFSLISSRTLSCNGFWSQFNCMDFCHSIVAYYTAHFLTCQTSGICVKYKESCSEYTVIIWIGRDNISAEMISWWKIVYGQNISSTIYVVYISIITLVVYYSINWCPRFLQTTEKQILYLIINVVYRNL